MMVAGTEAKSLVGMTREQLHELVWEIPMSRLAEEYGISGNGLAKICRRLNVPYPGRGWWAKRTAGQRVKIAVLPPGKDVPDVIDRQRRLPKPRVELIKEAEATIEAKQKEPLAVPERLVRPHPVVAGWLAEHERRIKQARSELDPDFRVWSMPKPFTATENRIHRFYDALLKALEKHGATFVDMRTRVRLEMKKVAIEFAIRQRYESVPLTPKEIRDGETYRSQPTGKLIFGIRTNVAGVRKVWSETAKKPLEAMLPDILAALLAAVPILVEEERAREEQYRRWKEERLEREERAHQLKVDEAYWQHFIGLAERQRQAEEVRSFIKIVLQMDQDPSVQIGHRSVTEWITWAQRRAQALDPLADGVEALFLNLTRAT